MAQATLVRTCHLSAGPVPAIINHALPPVTVLSARPPPSASRRDPTFIGCDIPGHHHEFSSAQFSSAHFSSALLTSVQLRAQLSSAHISSHHFSSHQFSSAQLNSAQLSSAQLSLAQLSSAQLSSSIPCRAASPPGAAIIAAPVRTRL